MVTNKASDSIVEEMAKEEDSEHVDTVYPPLTLSFTEPFTRFIREFENEIGNNPFPDWSHLTLEALHQMMNEECDALYVALMDMDKDKIAQHCLKLSTLSFYFSTNISRGMVKAESEKETKGKKKSSKSSIKKPLDYEDFSRPIVNSMNRDYLTEGQYITYSPTFSNTGHIVTHQG